MDRAHFTKGKDIKTRIVVPMGTPAKNVEAANRRARELASQVKVGKRLSAAKVTRAERNS